MKERADMDIWWRPEIDYWCCRPKVLFACCCLLLLLLFEPTRLEEWVISRANRIGYQPKFFGCLKNSHLLAGNLTR